MDTSYRGWSIADDSVFHTSLSVPYRSLDGAKGVIVFFLPKHAEFVSPNHALWSRLADDFAVYMERRKNAVDVSRISSYQLAVVDLLKDVLEVKDISAARNLVLTILTTRAESCCAWITAVGQQENSLTRSLLAARGNMPDATLRHWLENTPVGQRWLDETIQRMSARGHAFIDSVRSHSRLEAWCDTQADMKKIAVIGAWPLWNEAGLQAVLFVGSHDPDYFSTHMQVFLHQLAEILHMAEQQLLNKSEIIRRTRLYQALLDEADAVLKMQSEQPLIEEICRRLVDSTLFEAAWLVRPDKNDCLMTLAVVSSIPRANNQQSDELTTESAQNLLWHVWKTGQGVFPSPPLRIKDASTFNFPMAVLPVLRGSRIWGILAVRCPRVEYFSADVNTLLQRIVSLLGRGLDEMDLKKQLANEQHRQSWLASHDALTGLNNRRGLDAFFAHAVLRAQRNKMLLAVMIIDLDDFKPVNDTYGHEAGDLLLVKLAEALQAAVRSTDFLVRLGGDEFVLLLEGLHNTEDLQPILASIRRAVEMPVSLDGGIAVSVGCSAGLTLYPEDASPPDRLLRHADEALYVAKRSKQERSHYWVNYLDLPAAETDN
ncbi:hypothetical protein B1757_10560 [Acidithiobacillus marinus]|uniref:GGDEF domain-containing protein n=1 Tax=Acidithiobacillus marinus TaxID=187490 RepID=A0A2I1DJW1_9PROT|nr:sensor domain-containing diguanylate cyclase [Acidithiobacillus marinus]PKY10161.1 hypothetical protein B1757_10560 [Acidithiobacillus marinus]